MCVCGIRCDYLLLRPEGQSVMAVNNASHLKQLNVTSARLELHFCFSHGVESDVDPGPGQTIKKWKLQFMVTGG